MISKAIEPLDQFAAGCLPDPFCACSAAIIPVRALWQLVERAIDDQECQLCVNNPTEKIPLFTSLEDELWGGRSKER